MQTQYCAINIARLGAPFELQTKFHIYIKQVQLPFCMFSYLGHYTGDETIKKLIVYQQAFTNLTFS